MRTLLQPQMAKVQPTLPMTDLYWPRWSVVLLTEVERLLREGLPQKAIDIIGNEYLSCPWTANALAVCHLRLGNTAQAISHLRYIATDHASAALRTDVPVIFKTNLAAALLASGDVEGFLNAIEQLSGDDHPSVQQLRAAATRWETSLSHLERVLWNIGKVAFRQPRLDAPLGELRDTVVVESPSVDCLQGGRLSSEAAGNSTPASQSITGRDFTPLTQTKMTRQLISMNAGVSNMSGQNH